MSDSAFYRKLARTGTVRGAVRSERDAVASRARARFASHDRPGGHSITTTNGPVDAFVWLEGPAPRAIEFGHFVFRKDGTATWVEGLHVITGAMHG